MKMRDVKFVVLASLFLMVAVCVADAQVRVMAQVESSENIYAGEKFTYYVIIDGENRPGLVDLAALSKYNPQHVGNRDVSQRSVSITNGRRTESVTKRYVMTYQLTAAKAGVVHLPAVKVTVDGEVYTANPVNVKIQKPGTTNNLELVLELSKEQCYVGQPIIMTVKWFIRQNIVDTVGDFSFDVPAFVSDDFYIEDVDGPDSRQHNRSVNGVGVYVAQQPVVHNGNDCIAVSFSKVLIAKRPGQIEIAPAVVSADLVVGQQKRGFFGVQREYKRFMAKSQPVTLTVLSLPQAGGDGTEGFYGLVGRYGISTSAAPTKVNVGDPITFTIKIGPSSYLKPVQWPQLEKIKAMSDNFKIPAERSTPVIKDGFKIFTQTIRANNDAVGEIPPIPLVYFDDEQGRYVTARSEAIKLEVAETRIVTTADAEGRELSSVSRQVEAVKKGISANYEGLDTLADQRFSPLAAVVSPPYLFFWGFGVVAFLLSGFFKIATHTSEGRLAAKRRRLACRNAGSELRKIAKDIDSHQGQNSSELLVSVMRNYIGKRFDKAGGSLTGRDCEQIIIEQSGDAEIAGEYRQIMQANEAARYCGMQAEFDRRQISRVTKLIGLIDRKSPR